MAHEIDFSKGFASFAYAGEAAWHGLGQQIDADSSHEEWTKAAGMDFGIKGAPVIFVGADGNPHHFEGRKTLYRTDTNAGLGIVGDSYKVVQPADVMEFFADLISINNYRMETAGVLFGGRKYWALAKINDGARIMGQDLIKPYLLLATSCDGSMATAAHLTSVRVVCNNTLRMSIGNNAKSAMIRIPHSREFDPKSVKSELGIVECVWDNFIASVESLASLRISRDDAIQVVADELKLQQFGESEDDQLTTQEMLEGSAALRGIFQIYDQGLIGGDLRSTNGTAWRAVNAVTQFFDHANGHGDQSRAFERAHFTDRAKIKVAVANKFLAMAA